MGGTICRSGCFLFAFDRTDRSGSEARCDFSLREQSDTCSKAGLRRRGSVSPATSSGRQDDKA